MRHRPEPTRHGMHCTCGVFCGRDIESWRAHRDDLLILYPGADTRTDLAVVQDGLRAIAKAYAAMFERMGERMSAISTALNAEARRREAARARRLRAEQIAFLNRPVVTPVEPVIWHDESERLEVWGTLDPPDACMCRDCVLGNDVEHRGGGA